MAGTEKIKTINENTYMTHRVRNAAIRNRKKVQYAIHDQQLQLRISTNIASSKIPKTVAQELTANSNIATNEM